MPDTDEVLAERREGVLLVTLNRPAHLNAWTPPMRDRYVELLAQADRDERVRAVVITGSGRAFCSGADLSDSAASADSAPPESGPADLPLATPIGMGKPVVAAINGSVAGSGLAAALFTDVRFAASHARFTTAFSRRALAAERGIPWLLPKIVGLGTALDLLLSARTLLGDEAGELGLVDRVVPGDGVVDAALAYARTLAHECSSAAMAEIKQQVYAGLDSSLEVAARDAGASMIAALDRADPGLGGSERRHPPRFPPRDS